MIPTSSTVACLLMPMPLRMTRSVPSPSVPLHVTSCAAGEATAAASRVLARPRWRGHPPALHARLSAGAHLSFVPARFLTALALRVP